jgi:hypothetical protein
MWIGYYDASQMAWKKIVVDSTRAIVIGGESNEGPPMTDDRRFAALVYAFHMPLGTATDEFTIRLSLASCLLLTILCSAQWG